MYGVKLMKLEIGVHGLGCGIWKVRELGLRDKGVEGIGLWVGRLWKFKGLGNTIQAVTIY